MPSSWHILPLESRPGSVPPLLVKYSIDAKTGYNVCLTDLTCIWSETLDRRQIIRRGLDEDTSIDPSEDASQLKILLDKVQTAFQGTEGTFLELLPREGGEGLVVKANVALPSPLKPLVWPIYLEPSPPQILTEKLVLPLLGYHLVLKDEVDSLIGQMKSKDHVIGKLMDKLELSGVDIGSIFPGIAGLATGMKGGRWEKAGKLVRGLGPFNEGIWMEEMKARVIGIKSEDEILRAIFGSGGAGLPAIEDREITKFDPTNNWWENLNVLPRGQNAGPRNIPAATDRRKKTPEDGSEDEFQTQETPPHLKKPTRKQIGRVSPDAKGSPIRSAERYPVVDDDTTDDDLRALPKKPCSLNPGIVAKKRHDPPPNDSPNEETTSPTRYVSRPVAPKATSGREPKIKNQNAAAEPKAAPPTDRWRANSGSETTSDDDGNLAPIKTKPPLRVRYGDGGSAESHSTLDSGSEAVIANRSKFPDDEDEPFPENPLRKPKTRLGGTGGKRNAPAPDPNYAVEPSRSAATQFPNPRAQLGMIKGRKKALTPDVEPAGESSQVASPTKPKPQLGVIGGKKKEVIPDDTTGPSATKSSHGAKLGLIGGKGKAAASEQFDRMQKPKQERKFSPPPLQPTKVPTPPPETEEEKANRRRDELKRQLDAKSKAPAKKKRKF
ncbi:MAG: hypothetical protein M1839_006085 [Geoglossum umbratile]|nr:MAG: hypothetical protein M1839_006085 [Geoglossum umbratile]